MMFRSVGGSARRRAAVVVALCSLVLCPARMRPTYLAVSAIAVGCASAPPPAELEWAAKVYGRLVLLGDATTSSAAQEEERADEMSVEDFRFDRLYAGIVKRCGEQLANQYRLENTEQEIRGWCRLQMRWFGITHESLAEAKLAEEALLRVIVDYREGKIKSADAVDACFQRIRGRVSRQHAAEFERGFDDEEDRRKWLEQILAAWPTADAAEAELERLGRTPMEVWLFREAADSNLLWRKAMTNVYGDATLAVPAGVVAELTRREKRARVATRRSANHMAARARQDR